MTVSTDDERAMGCLNRVTVKPLCVPNTQFNPQFYDMAQFWQH